MKTQRIRRRRGVALPMVVVFLFVMLGLAAVVIDGKLGFIVHARLRTVADAAALEGLRCSGLSPAMLREESDSGAADGRLEALLDADVLERYRDLTHSDRPSDAYDPDSPSDAWLAWLAWLERASDVLTRLQAERAVRRFAGGELDGFASDGGPGPEMLPAMEADAAARGVGEVAVRPYRPLASDRFALELNLPQDGVQDPEGDLVLTAAALTVRLRRDGRDAVAGRVSSGPRAPRLFRPSAPTSTPSWSNGLATVAEGTAVLRPVRLVGPATAKRLGAAPFYFYIPTAAALPLRDATLVGDALLVGEAPCGRTFAADETVAFGDRLAPVASGLSPSGEGYVPLVASDADPTVQGFLWLAWVETEPGVWTIRPAGRVAPENASAVVRGPNDFGAAFLVGTNLLTTPVRGTAAR